MNAAERAEDGRTRVVSRSCFTYTISGSMQSVLPFFGLLRVIDTFGGDRYVGAFELKEPVKTVSRLAHQRPLAVSIKINKFRCPLRISAGLMTYRIRNVIEVLLGHPGGPFFQSKDGAWTIPKGEPDPDEDLQGGCAARIRREDRIHSE